MQFTKGVELFKKPMLSGWLSQVLAIVVTLFGAILRIVNFDRINAPIYDETYYAPQAYSYLTSGYLRKPKEEFAVLDDHGSGHWDAFMGILAGQDANSVFSVESQYSIHPPLGKWLLAWSEWLFGFTPLGWRFLSLVAGALSIYLVIRISRRLLKNDWLALSVGLVLSLENLHFVLSRTGMFDVFIIPLIVGGLNLLLWAREDSSRRLSKALLAGSIVCFGVAMGIKWSTAPYVFVALGIVSVDSYRSVVGSHFRKVLKALKSVGVFIISSFTVYVLTWIPWFLSPKEWGRGWAREVLNVDLPIVSPALDFMFLQSEMMSPSRLGERFANEGQDPLLWPLMLQATTFYKNGDEVILAIGNQVVWLAGLGAVIFIIARGFKKRPNLPEIFIVSTCLAGWLPWVPAGRAAYLFYIVIASPFFALGTGYLLKALWESSLKINRKVLFTVGCLALVAATFASVYPISVGIPVQK